VRKAVFQWQNELAWTSGCSVRCLLLVLFGLVMVFSASAVIAKANLGSPYAYVIKQAVWALLGLIALFVLMRIDYRRYNNPNPNLSAMAITRCCCCSRSLRCME
jgi:cell division protein FtsW (lipid II flippase)